MIPDHTLPLEDLPVGRVNSHFLDSGAFTQWQLAQKYAKENEAGRWAYFHTDDFYDYMEAYAKFIKDHLYAIDLYANLDVIKNPKLTWRNQRFLEGRHDLRPVPVVHYGTDLKWLQWYIDHDYEIIGLGGLVGSTDTDGCRRWISQAFEMVCQPPKYLPKVKLHGFGVTTYQLLIKFPWYSVDSTSWTKIGAFGGVLVPHKRRGKWDFSKDPYVMKVSEDSPDRKKLGKHILSLSQAERKIIKEWLEEIEVPLGQRDHYGDVIEWGVTTHHTYRKAANLFFFEKLREWLPSYPWAFRSTRKRGIWEGKEHGRKKT